MNMSSVLPSIDTSTETMTDFDKVDRIHKDSLLLLCFRTVLLYTDSRIGN